MEGFRCDKRLLHLSFNLRKESSPVEMSKWWIGKTLKIRGRFYNQKRINQFDNGTNNCSVDLLYYCIGAVLCVLLIGSKLTSLPLIEICKCLVIGIGNTGMCLLGNGKLAIGKLKLSRWLWIINWHIILNKQMSVTYKKIK